jgi:predicted nuclease with TOPRIM domain
MNWNAEMQSRLDQLRANELTGTSTAEEKVELAKLIEILEAEEARQLAPALTRLRVEQAALREKLLALQANNEDLAKLLHQQEQLVVDTRRWLTQFDQRHRLIQQTYTRITGDTLLPSSSG